MGGTEKSAKNVKVHCSIAHRIPCSGVMLLVALSAITLSMAACEDDAQSVRQVNESAAPSTTTAEPTTPSAEIRATELEDGDCVNSALPHGISIEAVVIVPCSGDWQYRVTNSFQVADAEAYPDEGFFLSQVSENCDRQTASYVFPSAQFELFSNVPLTYFADPDDGETIQVWETLTGNIDQHLDSDTFLLRLEEEESVAIFVESVSIDTYVDVGLPGLPETIAFDDDGLGGTFGTDSVLFYRAFQAGAYSILVSDATSTSVGGYLVGVEAIDALESWDDNGDGKITCDEATANSIAPVSFTHPAYEYMDDGDSDGVVCD